MNFREMYIYKNCLTKSMKEWEVLDPESLCTVDLTDNIIIEHPSLEETDKESREVGYSYRNWYEDYSGNRNYDRDSISIKIERGLIKTKFSSQFGRCLVWGEKSFFSEPYIKRHENCTIREIREIEKHICEEDLDPILEKVAKYTKEGIKIVRDSKDVIGASMLATGLITQNPLLIKKGFSSLFW